MFEPLGTPAFLEAARREGRKYSAATTFLQFILVYMIVSFAQNILVTPFITVVMLSDPAYYELINPAGTGGMLAVLEDEAYLLYVEGLYAKPLVVLGTVLSSAVFALGAVLFVRFFEKRSLFSMGFDREGAVSASLGGALGGIILFALALGFSLIFGGVTFQGISQRPHVGYLIAFFLAFLVQGFGEELLLRGFLMTSVARTSPLWFSVLISALAFSYLHSGQGAGVIGYVNLFLFGVFMSLYMIRTGSIFGAALLHGVWNYIQGLVCGFPVSGIGMPTSLLCFAPTDKGTLLHGGAFGPEASIAVTFALALGIAFFAMCRSKDQAPPENR